MTYVLRTMAIVATFMVIFYFSGMLEAMTISDYVFVFYGALYSGTIFTITSTDIERIGDYSYKEQVKEGLLNLKRRLTLELLIVGVLYVGTSIYVRRMNPYPVDLGFLSLDVTYDYILILILLFGIGFGITNLYKVLKTQRDIYTKYPRTSGQIS